MSMVKSVKTACKSREALEVFAKRHNFKADVRNNILTITQPGSVGWATVNLETGDLAYDTDYAFGKSVAAALQHSKFPDRASDEYNLCLMLTKYPDAVVEQDSDGHYYLDIEVEGTSESSMELVTE